MRLSTGLAGLDQLLGDGFIENRLYLLSGPPGSGKTTFCAQFVTRCAMAGRRCLYMSMHETEQELRTDMSNFTFDFEEAISSGRVTFLNLFDANVERLISPSNQGNYQSSVKNMTSRIVGFVNAREIDVLVIDSTMLLEYYFPENSGGLVRFLSSLKRADVTTLLISEMTDPTSYAEEHYLAHGVIFLHNYLEPTGMTRGLQLVKMRGTNIDCDIRKIEFTPQGLVVRPDEKIRS